MAQPNDDNIVSKGMKYAKTKMKSIQSRFEFAWQYAQSKNPNNSNKQQLRRTSVTNKEYHNKFPTLSSDLDDDKKYDESDTLDGNEIMVCLQRGNNSTNITISASATVYALKTKYIAKIKCNDYKSIVLLYMGQILDEKQTLEHFRIGFAKISTVFVAQKISSTNNRNGDCVGIIFTNKNDGSQHTLYMDDDIKILELKKIYKKYLLKYYESQNMTKSIQMLKGKKISFSCGDNKFAEQSLLKECVFGNLQYVFVSFEDEFTEQNEVKEMIKLKQTFEKSIKSPELQQSVKVISKTFKETSKHQIDQIKCYHEIEDIKQEARSENMKKATEYTKKVLSTEATGQLGSDINTTLHVINNIFKSTGDECIFYDSRQGVQLAGDSGCGMHQMFQRDKPSVLRLSTLDGLDGVNDDDLKNDTNKLVEMQSCIENGIEHPTLIHVKNKLSAALGVTTERINIIEVFAGSDIYTVADLTFPEKQQMLQQDPTNKLRQQFPQFKELKVHPLFFRTAFDVKNFDKRGNKSFVSQSGKYQVGPPGLKRTYTQPTGWTRYGLTVLGVYNDDKWLHPFNDAGNWWRAYHGTKNAGKYGVNPVDAMANVHNDGWKPAKTARLGPGVYCSPVPTFVENGYAGTVTIPVANQQKKFKFMLQVAVKPGNDTLTPQSQNHAQIWSVRKEENIRAYGLLIKEV